MATTQAIDATIFASSHPDIAKRTSFSGVLISSVMLVVGVIAFASTFGLEDKSSTVSMALMVLGTGLFLMGIFRLFWKSKEVVYLPTGSVAKEHSVFFDLKHMDSLVNIVNSGSFSADSEIKSESNGNIRMDIILSEEDVYKRQPLPLFWQLVVCLFCGLVKELLIKVLVMVFHLLS